MGRERKRLEMRGGVVAKLSGVNNRWIVASASGPEAPASLSGRFMSVDLKRVEAVPGGDRVSRRVDK